MPGIPDAISVASPDTHCLIVAVPHDGPAEISSNLPRPVAADVLRQIADQLEAGASSCGRARATGKPCPVHDRPASPSADLLAAGADAPAAFARGIARARRPDGLNKLLAAVAEQLPADDTDQAAGGPDEPTMPEHRAARLDDHARHLAEQIETLGKARGWSTWAADYIHPDREFVDTGAPEQPAERAVDETRENLEFNADQQSPSLAALRDALLDPQEHAPKTALATAYVLLAAHARELAEHTDEHARQQNAEMLARRDRSRVARCGGIRSVSRLLAARADELDRHATQ